MEPKLVCLGGPNSFWFSIHAVTTTFCSPPLWMCDVWQAVVCIRALKAETTMAAGAMASSYGGSRYRL